MSGRDICLALLICTTWAFNFLTSAAALQEIPPFLFTALRFAVLGLLLLPWMRRPAPGQWPRLIASGLLIGVAHFGLSFWSIREAGDISSPAVVMQSYVPMTAILAWPFLGEHFGWRTGLAIAISFLGVVVLAFDPSVLEQPRALILMLLSSLSIALATIVMKKLRGLNLANQQGWFAWIAIAPLLLISALFEPGSFAGIAGVSYKVWIGVFYAALMASLVGHGLYFQLLQRNPVAQVTPWLLLTPVLSIAIGVAFWGDRPGPRMFIGAAMVLSGVLMIALRALSKSRSNTPVPAEEI